jgi:DNA-binding transcriptional regulator YhcF (GntR family)
MSVGAKHWALAQKVEGGSSPRIILFFLADWMIGDDQTECWPSLDTLVFETGMNRQTIIKATAALERQGLISKRVQWLRADNGSLRKRVYYRLLGFRPEEWINSKRPESPKTRKSEISDVQETERTGSHTQEGTKNRTHLSTKNRTQEGTKFRTGTGNTGIRQEGTGIDTRTTPDDLVLFPDTEQPKAKSKRTKTTVARPDDVGEQVWDEFLILRKEKRKTFTELALRGMRREAEAAGITLEQAMTLCVEQGWQSFQAKYVRDKGGFNSTRPPQRSFNRPLSREQMALDDDF